MFLPMWYSSFSPTLDKSLFCSSLKGGSRQDQPDSLSEKEGFSCSTEVLNHPDTIDFGYGDVATFGGGIGGGVTMHDEREMLRDCYQVKLASSCFFIDFFSGSSQRSPA